MSVSQSVSQSVIHSFSLSVSLPVCLSVSQSVSQSVSLSVSQPVYLSASLSVCQSVSQSVYLSISVSQSVHMTHLGPQRTDTPELWYLPILYNPSAQHSNFVKFGHFAWTLRTFMTTVISDVTTAKLPMLPCFCRSHNCHGTISLPLIPLYRGHMVPWSPRLPVVSGCLVQRRGQQILALHTLPLSLPIAPFALTQYALM
jgi:hypothetical protein